MYRSMNCSGPQRGTWQRTCTVGSLRRRRLTRDGPEVQPSYALPGVSDDNAYVESLFRTAKYRPEFPARSFADLISVRHAPGPPLIQPMAA
jgi:transposase InsO family protein